MIFALLLALSLPARASDWSAASSSAAAACAQRAGAKLGQVRDALETLQELSLSPHRRDERVELALLHLDLAEAYLAVSTAAFESVLAGVAEPPGWTPLSERLDRALSLLAETAPDLAEAMKDVPIEAAALRGQSVAEYSPKDDAVRLRGWFAANAETPAALAAELAHEAVHVQQARKAGGDRKKLPPKLEAELEAYGRQAAVWKALRSSGAVEALGVLQPLAEAEAKGPEAFKAYVEGEVKSEPHWLWVEPLKGKAFQPQAPSLAALEKTAQAGGAKDPASAAKKVEEIRRLVADIQENFSDLALSRLQAAREELGDLVELAAPYPRIVSASIMEARALGAPDYPPSMWAVYGLLHPVLLELDRVRESLALRKLSERQLSLIEKYNRSRPGPFVREPFKAEELKAAFSADGAPRLMQDLEATPVAVCFGPDASYARAKPRQVLVPGRRLWREPRADFAAVWAAHAIIHREQGLKDGDEPSLDQEVEALDRAFGIFTARGLGEGFDAGRPDRYLAERAAAEQGPEVLRLYLSGEPGLSGAARAVEGR